MEIRNRAGEKIDYAIHPAMRSDAWVILGHGLTGDKDRPLLLALAEGLAAKGWPCLRISFAGNGDSEGRFEDSCISKNVSDLQSVIDALPAGVKIAYLGHSMGGAVGVLAAARDLRIQALVSLAGMTHSAAFCEREFAGVIPDEGVIWEDEKFPLSQKLVDDLSHLADTLSAAEAVTQPWLLVHGEADDVVPIQDSRDAYEAASSEKQWLEIAGADHLFGEATYAEIVDSADTWLRIHLA